MACRGSLARRRASRISTNFHWRVPSRSRASCNYTRNTNSSPWQYASNQMYIMSITNFFGVECWNSYSNNYPGPVTILARLTMALNLTNDAPGYSWPPPGTPNPAFVSTVATIPSWPGYGPVGSSFLTPFGTNAFVLWLTNSVYNYGPNNMRLQSCSRFHSQHP